MSHFITKSQCRKIIELKVRTLVAGDLALSAAVQI